MILKANKLDFLPSLFTLYCLLLLPPFVNIHAPVLHWLHCSTLLYVIFEKRKFTRVCLSVFRQSRLALAAAVLICIASASNSNPYRGTKCLDDIRGLRQSVQSNAGTVHGIRQRPLLSTSFPITYLLSSEIAMVHRLTHCQHSYMNHK